MENLDGYDVPVDNIQDQHSAVRIQVYAAMPSAVSAFWLRLNVERRAKIVAAPAPIHDRQRGHLISERRFTITSQELLQFR